MLVEVGLMFLNYFFFQLNIEAQNQVKAEMMVLVGKDNENITMRKKLAEVAAELIRNLIDDDGNNTWPEFLRFLFELANTASPILKENALILFALVPGIFGSQQSTYLDVIKQMLNLSFQNAEYSVRFYAAKALASFVTDHDKEDSVLNHFSDLVPFFIKATEESLRLQDDDALLKLAVTVAENVPGAVKKIAGPLISQYVQLV
jgi:hypothetical protein